MTQTPAADIVERGRNLSIRLRPDAEILVCEMATEIEALRAREAELKGLVQHWTDKCDARSERLHQSESKLDEAVKAQDEALALIDEINERGASRRFYGIDQPLHAKICTIRATLVRWQALASIRGETD